MAAPKARPRHRIPISVRHHWRLLVLAVALLALTIGGLGAYRVRPLVLTQGAEARGQVTDIAGTVDLFDAEVRHELTLTFAEDAYDRMVAAFQASDDKQFVEADLTIDGTLLSSVGIRLKGNSTLRSLGGGPGLPGGGAGGPGGGFGGNFGRGLTGTTLSFDSPEELPWLVSFDHFVDGRRYQGRENLALRPAGQTGSTLNEATALQLVAIAGEPTQRFSYVSLAVNDRPATTRLVVEVPDKPYADALGEGVLYKALSTSRFSDQGDDPTAYADDFDQVNRAGSQDMAPVIDLIRWVSDASDEEFDAELAEHVDVASFARYVALQNLLLNFDDMAGPGHNYYLYYDLDDHRFQVLTWDLNLALSGDASQGPFDSSSMFRGGVPNGGNPNGGMPNGGIPNGGFPNGGFPNGGAPNAGPGDGGGIMGGHLLKERFLASTTFRATYLDAYRELYQKLFVSGAADRALEAVVAAAGVAGAAVDQSQVDTLRTTIASRTQALAIDPDLAG